MTIYRNKKNKKLYTLALVSPPKYTGKWYVATPYFPNTDKVIKNAKLEDFVVVSER